MNKGFTILETMVAILILTIGIVFTVQIFPLCSMIEKSNKMENQAMFLAQEKIESEIFKTYQNIQVGTTVEDPLHSPYERFSRETRITYLNSDFEEEDSDLGLKKIEVIIQWDPPLKIAQGSMSIINLVAER